MVEQFIREKASLGWSKTRVRKALHLSAKKFWELLGVLPDVVWCYAQARATPAILSSLERARAAQRRVYELEGCTGTATELAELLSISERTVRRYIKKQGATP